MPGLGSAAQAYYMELRRSGWVKLGSAHSACPTSLAVLPTSEHNQFRIVAVEAMHRGTAPQKAAELAILRIKRFYPKFSGAIVAANKNGTYGAACAGWPTFGYSVVGPTSWAKAKDEKVRVETVTCI